MEQVNRIRERITTPDLVISRVPDNTLAKFRDLARSEFEGDYGFCLKFLVDYYQGIMFNGYNELFGVVQAQEARIIALEGKHTDPPLQSQETPDTGITMLNGKRIGGKG